MFKEGYTMTLRHIKIFVAVCQCGSVTAAAKKLYIAQPAASLAISELEEYYGVRLFDRIAKRLHITETGKQFLQYATHIVSLFDELDQRMRNWDNIGVLRIGTSVTIGNYLLPDYVKDFQQSHPHIKLQVIIDNTEKIESYVLKNEIDFGLIEGIIRSPFIESKGFMDDPLVLICSPSHPWTKNMEIDISKLKDENFILREKGSAGREIFENALHTHQVEIVPAWQSVSTQAIIKAVSKGLGVSILPYLLVKDNLEREEIQSIKIREVSLKRQFSIIYHKNKFLTDSAKAFIELCFQS